MPSRCIQFELRSMARSDTRSFLRGEVFAIADPFERRQNSRAALLEK